MTSSAQQGTIVGFHFTASGNLYTGTKKGFATSSLKDEEGNQKLSVHFSQGTQPGLN